MWMIIHVVLQGIGHAFFDLVHDAIDENIRCVAGCSWIIYL